MPWLLYRYMLLDLLRVIGLTTAVLVTVIAFGATLKPLSRGGVDAIQIAKYLGLVIVPMLQFALPFAAGFGSTMSFYRLTTDNEIQAMAVSGISYRRMLLPVAAFGVVLTLAMVVLTQAVIPKFWATIVQTVSADVVKFFQASIERGEAFQLGKMQIYADRLIIDPKLQNDPNGPQTRMMLWRVAAADLDDQGRIVTDITAKQAWVDVYRRQANTYIKLVMEDAVALNAQTGHLVHSERIAPPQAIAVPNVMKANTKALNRTQLLQLRENPDAYFEVVRAKEALASSIEQSQVRQVIDSQLRSAEGGGQLELISEHPSYPRVYIIKADQLQPSGLLIAPRGRLLEIVQYERDQPMLRFRTNLARLAPAADGSYAPGTGTLFDLVIGEHDVLDLSEPTTGINKRANLVIPNLRVAGQAQSENLAELPSAELFDRAQTLAAGRVDIQIDNLRHELESIQHEITGRLTSRYALSITAFLLLMLGATMAMWHRQSLPLTTYVWAFFPAVGALILVSAGEQMLRDGREWGHVIMWSGNSVLLLFLCLSFWKLSRN